MALAHGNVIHKHAGPCHVGGGHFPEMNESLELRVLRYVTNLIANVVGDVLELKGNPVNLVHRPLDRLGDQRTGLGFLGRVRQGITLICVPVLDILHIRIICTERNGGGNLP